jgi:hypothetical protein
MFDPLRRDRFRRAFMAAFAGFTLAVFLTRLFVTKDATVETALMVPFIGFFFWRSIDED